MSTNPFPLKPKPAEETKWASYQDKLLELRNEDQSLDEKEAHEIIDAIIPLLLTQPILIEVDTPITICGDVHGQLEDLLRLYDYIGWPPGTRYLFLGDYVDRGKRSIEVILLQFLLKLRYPYDFYILRGNHESYKINRVYGFYEECRNRYDVSLWRHFQNAFNCLPLSALVSGRIFCMHGGLPQELLHWDQIRRMKRPSDVPESGIMCDLLWADPNHDGFGWEMNPRGVSWLFGEDAVIEFCQRMDIDLVARAHQVVQEGYEFFAKHRLVTIFSAPNYGGDFGNIAGAMSVDKNLRCKITQLKPVHS
uniref:Serine/threonine-protein phosphatase n=1 Tax=Trichuris muris TaxID=70415 RepID=A0A5S6QP74_TRIMR